MQSKDKHECIRNSTLQLEEIPQCANYLVFPKQYVVTLCALVLCVYLSVYLHRECTVALYSFISKVYGRIRYFKEIQCCRVKTNVNELEILNLDEKNSFIVRNYLVFPKQQVLTLCALILLVCLSLYFPQWMHCTIFSQKNMCEYHILRKYRVAE